MNMKKFLTVFILGIAVFAVSCSDDDNGTTPSTPSIPTADVTTFMSEVYTALASVSIGDNAADVVNFGTDSDDTATLASLTGTGKSTSTINSAMQSAIDGIAAANVPATIDLSTCTVEDDNSNATVTGGNTYTFTLTIAPANSDSYKAVTKTLSITITG